MHRHACTICWGRSLLVVGAVVQGDGTEGGCMEDAMRGLNSSVNTVCSIVHTTTSLRLFQSLRYEIRILNSKLKPQKEIFSLAAAPAKCFLQ